METFMVMVMDMFKRQLNTNKKKIFVRFFICVTFFLCGLTMTTRGGFFILNLIDGYIAGYPLLVVGLLQVIVVPWVYGKRRWASSFELLPDAIDQVSFD